MSNNTFFPLHIFSGYSFFKSSIKIEDLVKEAKKRNYQYLGISDIDNLYVFPKFNSLCLKEGIKPIFGLTLDVKDNLNVSFYAKNEEGYKALIYLTNYKNKLITFQTSLNDDINESKIDLISLKDVLKDNVVIVISTSSKIFNEVSDKIIQEFILPLKDIYQDDLYIGLSTKDDFTYSRNNLIKDFVTSFNIKTIPFPLIRNVNKDEGITLKILEYIEKNMTTSISEIENLEIDSFPLPSDDEIKYYFKEDDLANLNELVLKINFTFKKVRAHLLSYSNYINSNENSDELLIKKIYEGLNKRKIDLSKNKNYRNRLNYEYLTIKKMGYSNYFLIVQDYISFAKENNILVGPGRGSAAGSLISYLLGITEIDPLKYGLLFERFLNPERKSMPDIDVDFQDVRRDEVISYLERKYGINHVSKVLAIQNIKAKNALRDVARVLGFNTSFIDPLNKKIPVGFKNLDGSPDYSLEDAYKRIPAFKNMVQSSKDYETIYKNAKLIEGLPRQRGQHAAGIILTNEDIFEVMPINYISQKEIISQFEKDYLEEQGFLKFDILGLSNLTIIHNTLTLVKNNYDISLKFEDIPISDPKIFNLLKEGNLMGLFQADKNAVKRALLDIKPDNFKEVADAISLARPGPIEFIPTYVKRKNKKEKVTYPSKDLEPILKSTYGIIIYQEQIMRIAQKYSSFTFAEADTFRRAIAKKHYSDIIEMKDKFIKGALKNKHNEKEAIEIFNHILKFASYGFNLSHAISYAVITCRMAYLKATYPTEFYASILTSNQDEDKINNYLSEIKKEHVSIELPNINLTNLYFVPTRNSLIFPISKIKGIPSKLAYNIVKEREERGPYTSYQDFIFRSVNFENKLNDKQLSTLINAGCFDTFNPNRKQLKMQIPDAMDIVSLGGKSAYDIISGDSSFSSFKFDSDVKDDKLERINFEYEALGMLISDSLLNYVNLSPKVKSVITPISLLKTNVTSYILGTVKSVKTINIKNGKDKGKVMAFALIGDNDSEIDTTIFSSIFDEHSDLIKANNILLLKGKKEVRNDKISFIVENMKEVKLNEQ